MTTRLTLSFAAVVCVLGLAGPAAYAKAPSASVAPQERAGSTLRLADFRGQSASHDVRLIADWAVHTRDHRGLPFIIVDKVNAAAYAFEPSGRLVRSTSVLLGTGIGDVFPPGVADMDMYATKPWQRVTPAGRFEADIDVVAKGKSLLWVDYDTGIALHKIPSGKSSQRRHERIKSARAADKRMTYGCINVPAAFFDQVVYPAFKARGGMVYVLPESSPAAKLFGAYDVRERAAGTARQTSVAATAHSAFAGRLQK
jgi:hypothetical protein